MDFLIWNLKPERNLVALTITFVAVGFLVELVGIEPTTSSLRTLGSANRPPL
jgi:hypothetical protein